MWYALLTILFGLVGLYIGRRGYAVVNQVSKWPAVPGRIVERGVRGAGRYYKPYARHLYTVDGTEYQNDQVYPIEGTQGMAGPMQKVVDALPEAVDVHYDPANPASTYLLKQPMGTLHIATVFGGVVTTVGVLMLLVELLGG